MKIWIDISTGTYGDVEDIYIVDLPKEELDRWDHGQMSDFEIAEYPTTVLCCTLKDLLP